MFIIKSVTHVLSQIVTYVAPHTPNPYDKNPT